MKKILEKSNGLSILSENELNEINGGSLFFDILYEVGYAVGYVKTGVVNFLTDLPKNNPATLNSGTYYGR
jgi:bacteriocin-like protein